MRFSQLLKFRFGALELWSMNSLLMSTKVVTLNTPVSDLPLLLSDRGWPCPDRNAS